MRKLELNESCRGRNVCVYWLVGACARGADCAYAHDAAYLPAHGWWTDPDGRMSRLRNEFEDAADFSINGLTEALASKSSYMLPVLRNN